MNKSFLISIFVAAAVVAGYIVHRILTKPCPITNEVLTLKNVLDWAEKELAKLTEEKDSKLEINILPNLESQKLLKTNNKYLYVAVLRKVMEEQSSVISTKAFYAKSVDVDLNALNQGNVVVIPIA